MGPLTIAMLLKSTLVAAARVAGGVSGTQGNWFDEPAPAAYPGESPETALAVATLTRAAKDVVEGAFTPLWVRGEITDFKAHRNGHWYFALRDADAQREAAWCGARRHAAHAPHAPHRRHAGARPTAR